MFTIAFKKVSQSPFIIPGIKTKTAKDILQAVYDSRERNFTPIYLSDAHSMPVFGGYK